MAPAPICLILGSGANIGTAIARRFAGIGYQIAVVSRSALEPPAKNPDGYLSIKADLADKGAYPGIYSKVKASLGGIPSVVVYNAASLHFPAEAGNLFSVSTEQLQQDMDVSVYGAYLAAGEAYKLWSEENDGGKKTFIYTGNCLTKTILPVPSLVTLGITKNASWYWLGLADVSYKQKGFRFFYADQRTAQGGPAGNQPDAEAHGEMYTRLAQDPDAYPNTYITFVDGTKVVEF